MLRLFRVFRSLVILFRGVFSVPTRPFLQGRMPAHPVRERARRLSLTTLRGMRFRHRAAEKIHIDEKNPARAPGLRSWEVGEMVA
jgi:hypothetical protein